MPPSASSEDNLERSLVHAVKYLQRQWDTFSSVTGIDWNLGAK